MLKKRIIPLLVVLSILAVTSVVFTTSLFAGSKTVLRDTLSVGEKLVPGQSLQVAGLYPKNGAVDGYIQGYYTLAMQGDGVLTYSFLNNGDFYKEIWSTELSGKNCIMQNDGNLVLFGSDGKPVWSSGTAGEKRNDYRLRITSNGTLAIFKYHCVWSSKTSTTGYPEVVNYANKERLYVGDLLTKEGTTTIKSDNEFFKLTLQSNGNLVLLKGKTTASQKTIWSTNTSNAICAGITNPNTNDFEVQGYDKNGVAKVIWKAKAIDPNFDARFGDMNLTVQNDGNLVLYRSNPVTYFYKPSFN